MMTRFASHRRARIRDGLHAHAATNRCLDHQPTRVELLGNLTQIGRQGRRRERCSEGLRGDTVRGGRGQAGLDADEDQPVAGRPGVRDRKRQGAFGVRRAIERHECHRRRLSLPQCSPTAPGVATRLSPAPCPPTFDSVDGLTVHQRPGHYLVDGLMMHDRSGGTRHTGTRSKGTNVTSFRVHVYLHCGGKGRGGSRADQSGLCSRNQTIASARERTCSLP